MTPDDRDETRAVAASMGPAERRFMGEIARKGTPEEARTVFDVFKYFPGARLEAEPKRRRPPDEQESML